MLMLLVQNHTLRSIALKKHLYFSHIAFNTTYIVVCLLVSFLNQHVFIGGQEQCLIHLCNKALGTVPGTWVLC